MFCLFRKNQKMVSVWILSLALLAPTLNALAGGGNAFQTSREDLSAPPDPYRYFLDTYGYLTLVEDQKNTYFYSKDLKGKKVALYFKDEDQPTLVEGVFNKVETYIRYNDDAEERTGFMYVIKLADGSEFKIRCCQIIELRADLTEFISPEEFHSRYKEWDDLTHSPPRSKVTAAFLVTMPNSMFKLVEGNVQSISNPGSTESLVYRINTRQGEQSIDSNSIVSMRIKPFIKKIR